MQRLATTVAIAAWIGFLGVFSVELAANALAPGLLAAVASYPWPQEVSAQFGGVGAFLGHLPPAGELAVSAACLVIVGLFARSLILLHARDASNRAGGELSALVALAAVAVLAGASQLTTLPLLPIDTSGGLVWLAIALSIAAVVFDRLVVVEPAESDAAEAEFEAGLSALAQRMGRQAALYSWPEQEPTGARKDDRP
ncbi:MULTISPECIES: hypothetical protein [unclassified Aureimonas]|uniref:hypothetical protein n=1 Tax=unclassified Aureimonas TaxID=2615206 RepID=UPI0006F23ADC|nr:MULTISPECIES: hypothetical protein [unclassified Aureimonas]KQT60429.1 hypothetical protein ASG62_07210 [Aureimonas sp. Leaf427]KQT79307.1 hypothetical protein ASG54_09810 [Aureimonas sp. Leaf460]